MLENGFTSGCLTIISNNFQINQQAILRFVQPSALQEWNQFDDWENGLWSFDKNAQGFGKYYKLNKKEKVQFDSKFSMPDSFVEKYFLANLKTRSWFVLSQIPNILYHKKNPYTQYELIQALIAGRMYEVRCNICNRTYFIDEYSLTCVRWRTCVGADCLRNTVSNEGYLFENLCSVNNHSNALQSLTAQLSVTEGISSPLSFYGGSENLHISYISDLHLFHHLNDGISLRSLVTAIVKNLYATMSDQGIIVFAGDISSSASLTLDFYKKFVQYNAYLTYKEEKDRFLRAKASKSQLNLEKQMLEERRMRLSRYIKALETLLLPHLDFDVVEQYKNRYHADSTWVDAIMAYKKCSSYKSRKISHKCDSILDLVAPKLDALECLNSTYFKFQRNPDSLFQCVIDIEDTYGDAIERLTVSDVCKAHRFLCEERQIFVVLGNHEYIGFDSVKEAVAYFTPKLSKLGIKLLHNNYYEFTFGSKTCVIFGGTGFAKYNPQYNADSLTCCNNFSREDEIGESSLFEEAYLRAKQHAGTNSCFICVSHYPIQDCYGTIDCDTVYFYGHNHQNFYCKNESGTIYADNQIGYKTANIAFKVTTTGAERNPYFALEDGLYKTTIPDYLQFNRHIGEYIGDGSLLYQRCQNNKAHLYVIKRKGYYGFFIMNPNAGASKGISIVNGGKTKKITKSIDLQWLFDNFESVLCKYLQVLAPFRKLQEQISTELKQLGFLGTIHGCIIDIDFYHHIAINPVEGTMTYYYSSSFGLIQPLLSFENVIKSIQIHDVGWFASNRNYDWIQQQFLREEKKQTLLIRQS